MATKIWSYVIGNWQNVSGYVLIPIGHLAGLVSELGSRGLHGINELVIFAHGDQGGLVQIKSSANGEKDLTPETLPEFLPHFEKLDPHLAKAADLAFFGCVCAQGSRGDRLLTKISGVLPGRKIVGFNTFLWYSGGLYPARPGQVKDTGQTRPINLDPRPKAYAGKPLLTISSESAKWVINGEVKKRPKGDSEFAEGAPIPKLPLYLDKELHNLHQRIVRETNPKEKARLAEQFMMLMRERERKGKYYEVPRK